MGRFYLVFAGLALIVTLIIVKLFWLQVVNSDNLREKAQAARHQSLALYNRGRILDRNGIVLAQDTLVYDIYAHPRYYFKTSPAQIAAVVAPILGMPVDRLAAKLSEPFSTISLRKNVAKEVIDRITAARIKTFDIDNETGEMFETAFPVPGLDFAKKPVRNYPQGGLAAHVLGYVNDEADISAGIEYTARHILRKTPAGMQRALLSGRGEPIDVGALPPETLVRLPKAEDVTLTLDARLQYIAERELKEGLEAVRAKRGTVIMMDPRTGGILAFAVLPAYLPDQYHKASARELKNWALSDVYPPGSTFKILTVAAGLEAGVIDRNSRIHDTGKMEIGGWPIRNYDYARHGAPGMIDLTYLLQHSSNIGSAKIAMRIPQDKYVKILQDFGMGRKTGIDLPGESAGLFDGKNKWDVATHASLGYGYGIGTTPIQIAAAIAAIANGGVWHTPHLLEGREDLRFHRVLSEGTARTVTDLLSESIATAETSTVRLADVAVAGKTGTSRKPSLDGRGYSDEVFTSFVGYFPAEDPQVLVLVLVDSPQITEAWGSTVAGPIFKAIAEETVAYLGLRKRKQAAKAAMPGRIPPPDRNR